MGFREREKKRLVPLKEELFSAEACKAGIYRRKRYDFCLRNDCASENLHGHVRENALRYFEKRNIPWHDGIGGGPSNHLCCSQSSCVNFWFPFGQSPEALTAVLRELGYDVAEVLPFEADTMPPDDENRYVAFEWIGKRNYLKEHIRGRVAQDTERQRGQNFTSLDFAFRFRRSDGLIQIVAGEWKYTERYSNGQCIQRSRSGTDRLEEIYAPALDAPDCQIALNGLRREALFFDPFDQLMRQQLLCSAMERHGEIGADVVSLLRVPLLARHVRIRVRSQTMATGCPHRSRDSRSNACKSETRRPAWNSSPRSAMRRYRSPTPSAKPLSRGSAVPESTRRPLVSCRENRQP